MRNIFLVQIETTPAFQLGMNDANKIVKEWIKLKETNPHLRMKPDEKLKIFKEAAAVDEI